MNSNRKSILFVDDEKYLLTILQRLFAKEKWKMFFTQSGIEGLEILNDQKIDLVISDIHMPQMDGITFLIKVKENYPQTVRFLLSGSADQSVVEKAVAAGYAEEVFPKPWDDDKLRQAIRTRFS